MVAERTRKKIITQLYFDDIRRRVRDSVRGAENLTSVGLKYENSSCHGGHIHRLVECDPESRSKTVVVMRLVRIGFRNIRSSLGRNELYVRYVESTNMGDFRLFVTKHIQVYIWGRYNSSFATGYENPLQSVS